MIVKMRKVQIVVRRQDREKLVDTLGDMGVMHITPINPLQAVPDINISGALDNLHHAIQLISLKEPSGNAPKISANEAVEEILTIQKTQAELDSHLNTLHRQLTQQSIWGDTTLEDIQTIKAAGFNPRFYILSSSEIDNIKDKSFVVINQISKDRSLIAVMNREGDSIILDGAEPILTPSEDNPSIKRQAAKIDAQYKRNNERLQELAHLLPQMQQLQAELELKAEVTTVRNGALTEEDLFAIEGWVTGEQSSTLSIDLDKSGILAGVKILEPTDEELPPTLIRYHRLISPIKGLFNILNTFPGYREIDLAPFFMIAMPILAAMLIGDGGYGLVFLLMGVYLYRKAGKTGGEKELPLLLIITGLATFTWGVLTANFFGVTPETLAHAAGGNSIDASDEVIWDNFNSAEGFFASLGHFMADIAPLWREDGAQSRELLIKISFLTGTFFLITAHVRRMASLFPSQETLAEIGWSLVLASMLGVIWAMFFEAPVPTPVILAGLGGGLGLIILFGAPNPNPIKRVLIGFASCLMPLIGTFGDTMSYIRLMAVGLASYYIAFAFNDLGATIASSASWGPALPVIAFGHALNIALCIIAIFAHGVRLNMLEFSSNAGVQWVGYAYSPYSKIKS